MVNLPPVGDDINFSYGYYSRQWSAHFMDDGGNEFPTGMLSGQGWIFMCQGRHISIYFPHIIL
jgi:hypothetical protein